MAREKPIAVFMAFGTKGDVYPIAAIAAAFASDQKQYNVILISHSAHESLSSHLAEKHVEYCSVSSPPVLSVDQNNGISGVSEPSFALQKQIVTRDHRKECYSAVERIFGEGQCLEGWSLAELFHVRCILAAPYVVPYSAPASFERQFCKELPLLYKYLNDGPCDKVCWEDVIHWMWPLFTEHWGSWRYDDLHLSQCPFTDPVTGVPTWHHRPQSPLVMYGFSKEVVECPAYWPSKVRVCGFWFLPMEWQFTCTLCREVSIVGSSEHKRAKDQLCLRHVQLQNFIKTTPIFVGLSSIGSMGFLKDPRTFICVLQTVLVMASFRFILFTAGYKPLESVVHMFADETSNQRCLSEDCVALFSGRLLCFSGSMPYHWLFPKCAAVIHHGGSGTTAAALRAGTPQVVCPFMLDQFYWAERTYWLGVSSEPLHRNHLLPDKNDERSVQEAAHALSSAIHNALSPKVKARAAEIAERISHEDGVSEAVKALKEELGLV
ncbi:sterol 3-beta-glucosyltransferase UGT80B1 isoform X3 [Prosopis cineraria]|uniref:sterol 3-beta-glucosyltransferase UGT80B1 isoform X3 n=1 Tax=Prosopis cineraria TaxID=364024 RepID=UPI0024109EB1|nr:sterol 3-beta-glucosyltransferase UGT80B1 isoform X3 [Prosopis cineraria]